MINTYKKTYWVNENINDLSIGTPISAKNMNNIENGIYNLDMNIYKLKEDIDRFVKLYGDDNLIDKMTLREVNDYVMNKIKIIQDYLDSLISNKKGKHLYLESTLEGKTKKLSVKGTMYKNYFKKFYDTEKDYLEFFIEMQDNKFIARYNTHGLKLFTQYTIIFTIIIPSNLLDKGILRIIDNDNSYYVCEESDPIIPNSTCLLIKKKFIPLSINSSSSITSYLKTTLEFKRVDLDINDYMSKIIMSKPVILEGDMTNENTPCYFDNLCYPAKDYYLKLIGKNYIFKDFFGSYINYDNKKYYVDFKLENEDNITFYNGSNRTVYIEEYHVPSNTLARTFKIGAKKSHYFKMSGYSLNKTRIIAYKSDNWNSENKEELGYCMFLSGEIYNSEVNYLNMDSISNEYSFKLPYTLKSLNEDVYDSCYIDETKSKYIFKSMIQGYVFKGTEAWGNGPSTSNDLSIIFKINTTPILPNIKKPLNNDEIPVMESNQFPIYSYNQLMNIKDLNGIAMDSNGIIYVRILKRLLSKSDLSSFKAYLKNSLICIFERKVPIIQEYDGDLNVDTYDGCTYITSEFPYQPLLSVDKKESFANNIYNMIIELQKISSKINSLFDEIEGLKKNDIEIENKINDLMNNYNNFIKKRGE